MKGIKIRPTIFTILMPILIIYLIWIGKSDDSNQGGILYALFIFPLVAFLVMNIIFLIFIKDRRVIYTIELIIIIVIAFIYILIIY